MKVIIKDGDRYQTEITGVTEVNLVDDNSVLEIKEAPGLVWYTQLYPDTEVKITNE